jgi:hypothetical protein
VPIPLDSIQHGLDEWVKKFIRIIVIIKKRALTH